MSLNTGKAKRTSGGVLAPAGNHPARCFSIIDLGSHTDDGKFGVQTNQKIRISWELPDELHEFDRDKGPQPFAVHMTLNFVISPKSNLLKLLEGWRGKPFTEEELHDFELKKVLGVPCMVNVVHTQKGDQTYANVESVTPLPKKMAALMSDPVNRQVYYEVEMGRNNVFRALPDWIQEMIGKCNEWKDQPPPKPARTVTDDDADSPPDDIFGDKEGDEEETDRPF
jgi:hypothetical protein